MQYICAYIQYPCIYLGVSRLAGPAIAAASDVTVSTSMCNHGMPCATASLACLLLKHTDSKVHRQTLDKHA